MENFIKIQQQNQCNLADFASFSRGLNNWGKEIKEKDEALLRKKAKNSQDLSNPAPLRSKQQPKQPSLSKPAPRSHREWDKFDIDAALEAVDNDEPQPVESKTKEALECKTKGNTFLVKSDFETAIEWYTKGMHLDPNIPELPANRGWAYWKQKKFFEAEQDYSLALTINPVYTKVIKRRAQVRIELGKVSSAENDLKR